MLVFNSVCESFFFFVLDKSSSILSEYKKQEEDLQQLDIRLAQKEKILRDLRDKEDSLKEELTSLKNKLKDLEHKHKGSFDCSVLSSR